MWSSNFAKEAWQEVQHTKMNPEGVTAFRGSNVKNKYKNKAGRHHHTTLVVDRGERQRLSVMIE